MAIALIGGIALGVLWGSLWQRRRTGAWQSLAEHLSEGILQVDGAGRILWASDRAARLLGYPGAIPFGLSTEDLFGDTLTAILKDPCRRQKSPALRGTARRPNGDWFHSSLTWVGPIGSDQLWLLRDLSDQQALERLRASEERYNASQKFAQIGVWDWLLGTDDLFWSEEIYAMFGVNPDREKPSYRLFCEMVHPEDADRVSAAELACIHDGQRHDEEYRIVRRDGTVRWLRETGNILRDDQGQPCRMVGVVRDITEERQARQGIDAGIDPLTGLPNRVQLQGHLSNAITEAQRSGRSLALAFIDLDRFKPINDTHGHATGDRVLAALAGRLRDGIRPQDFAARVGGDEFIVAFPNPAALEDTQRLASRVHESLTRPLTINGVVHQLGASIGVAVYPDHSRDLDRLIDLADKAMYTAKRQGLDVLVHGENERTP
jgi:diguanylate cyclase (GGDEF)-like protein/PAS domain S-box-containing protein